MVVDRMTRIVVNRAIDEGVFKYEYTWRKNSDIIGVFINCMEKVGINKWAMIRLRLNIFYSTWCQGIVEAITGLDEDQCVPLPEMYMEHPSGSLIVENIPRRPTLIIRDRVDFNMAWPKMEMCFHFLLGWRNILVATGQD